MKFKKRPFIFSSDTGLLVAINEQILLDVIKSYDYDELVDAEIEPINSEYWQKLISKYNPFDIALILSPGINSGYDFVGSGTYKIM